MADDEQDAAGYASAADIRTYLFEMLAELSVLAQKCGEARVAVVLSTIVAVLHRRVETAATAAEQGASLQ